MIRLILLMILIGLFTTSQALQLYSLNFKNNDRLPDNNVSCYLNQAKKNLVIGNNISPSFTWNDIPKGTQSFVLAMKDPDIPKLTEAESSKLRTIPKNLDNNDLINYINQHEIAKANLVALFSNNPIHR